MSDCRNNALARASSRSSFASGRGAPLAATCRSTEATAFESAPNMAVPFVTCALGGIGAEVDGAGRGEAAGWRLLWLGARPVGSREGVATTVEAFHAAR